MLRLSRTLKTAIFLGIAGLLGIGGFIWQSQPGQENDEPIRVMTVPGDPRTIEQLEQGRFGALSVDSVNKECEAWVVKHHWEFGRRIKEIEDSGVTSKTVEASFDEFQRQRSAEYERLTKDDEAVRIHGRKLLDGWIAHTPDDPSTPTMQQLGELATSAVAAGSKDVLIRAMARCFHPVSDYEVVAKEFALLPEELTNAGYSHFFRVLVQRNRFAQALNSQAANAGAIAGDLIDDTAIAMEEASSRPEEIRFAWFTLSRVSDQLRGNERRDLYRAMLLREKTDPVLIHLLAGRMLYEEAYKIRGTGFVDTIGKDQLDSYGSVNDQAAMHYRKAWLLRPDLPQAPHALLSIESETPSPVWSPRQWFELSCRAQKDYAPAYRSFRQTLLPKWGGSHPALLAFGQECAETLAFDTSIPQELFECAAYIAAETPEAASWENRNIVAALNSFWKDLDEWLTTPAGVSFDKNRLEWHLSMRAAIALRNRNYGEAREALDRATWPPDPGPLTEVMTDASVAASMAYALSEPDSQKLIENEKRYGKNVSASVTREELAEAIGVLRDAKSESTTDRSHRYFLTRERSWELLSTYMAGDWVDLKFEQPLTLWVILNGEAKIESESSMLISNIRIGQGFLRAVPTVPFNPPYTVIADIERMPGDQQHNLVGIDVGPISQANYFGEPGGLAFVIGNEPRIAGTFAPSNDKQQWYFLQGLEQKAEMRVNIRRTSYELFVNQNPIPVLPVNEFRPNQELGFGGNQFQADTGTIRISNVRIRKLTLGEPLDSDAPVDERVAYYTQAVEHDAANLSYQFSLAGPLLEQEKWEESLKPLEVVYRVRPDFGPVRFLLASAYLSVGREAEAAPLFREALEQEPDNPSRINGLAWLYATAKTDSLRNGAEALKISTQLCEKDAYATCEYIYTQAAAFAATGNFKDALKAMEKAKKIATPEKQEYLNKLLTSFQNGQPWRNEN